MIDEKGGGENFRYLLKFMGSKVMGSSLRDSDSCFHNENHKASSALIYIKAPTSKSFISFKFQSNKMAAIQATYQLIKIHFNHPSGNYNPC